MSDQPTDTSAEPTPPADEDLEEPSTEKAPGEEPKAAKPADPEPNHLAVGIGVIDAPLTGPDGADEESKSE